MGLCAPVSVMVTGTSLMTLMPTEPISGQRPCLKVSRGCRALPRLKTHQALWAEEAPSVDLGVGLAQTYFLSWLVAASVPHTVLSKLNTSVLFLKKVKIYITSYENAQWLLDRKGSQRGSRARTARPRAVPGSLSSPVTVPKPILYPRTLRLSEVKRLAQSPIMALTRQSLYNVN